MWVFQPQSSKNRQICMKRESKFWYRLICQSSINPLLPILIWLIWRTRALVFPYRLICLNILLPAHLTHMPNKSLRPFIPTHLTHERLFSFENIQWKDPVPTLRSVQHYTGNPAVLWTLYRERWRIRTQDTSLNSLLRYQWAIWHPLPCPPISYTAEKIYLINISSLSSQPPLTRLKWEPFSVPLVSATTEISYNVRTKLN